jgi:hypothetical protein
VPKPDPESLQQAFDSLTTKAMTFFNDLGADADAAMCSRSHLWKLIRKGTEGCIRIIRSKLSSQALKILKESLIQGKEATRKHFENICQGAKGPSVRNYLSNRH